MSFSLGERYEDSATTHEMYDFQDILVGKGNRRMFCPWNDVTIALHRDRSLRQSQVVEQASNRQSLGDGVLITVDRNSHYGPEDTSLPSDAPAAPE